MTQITFSSDLLEVLYKGQDSSFLVQDSSERMGPVNSFDFDVLINSFLEDAQSEANSVLKSDPEFQTDFNTTPIDSTDAMPSGKGLPDKPAIIDQPLFNPFNLSGFVQESDLLENDPNLLVSLPDNEAEMEISNSTEQEIDSIVIEPVLKPDQKLSPLPGSKSDFYTRTFDRQTKSGRIPNTVGLIKSPNAKIDPGAASNIIDQPIKPVSMVDNINANPFNTRPFIMPILTQTDLPNFELLNRALSKLNSKLETGSPASSNNLENTLQLIQSSVKSTSTPTARFETLLPMPTTDQTNWQNGLSERLVWLVKNNIHQAEIKLNPPNLGHLEVKLTVHNDQTSILISSQNGVVRELVESTLVRLREMFTEQGLNLLDVNVSDKSLPQQERESRHPAYEHLQPENKEHQQTQADNQEPPVVLSNYLVDFYA